MAILKQPDGSFILDVRIPADESPTGSIVRVRKVAKGDLKDASLLHASIEMALRVEGKWDSRRRKGEVLPVEGHVAIAEKVKGTLKQALELAWDDPEDGWRLQSGGLNQHTNASRLIAILGAERSCASITRDDYNRLRVAMAEKGCGETTITRKLQAFHRVLFFAERKGWIKGRIKWKRAKGYRRKFTFDRATRADIEAYFKRIEDIKPFMLDLFILGCETGMRLGELLRMEGRHAKLDQGFYQVTKSKNGEQRSVVLTPRAHEVIKRRMATLKHGPLFPGVRGRDVSDQIIDVRNYLKQDWNGEFVFHATRHTHATDMAESEVSLVDMMQQLGHKTPSMSLGYIHDVDTSRKRNILQRLGHDLSQDA